MLLDGFMVEWFDVGFVSGYMFCVGVVVMYVFVFVCMDDVVVGRFVVSDFVFVDGMFWCDDELVCLGVLECSVCDMGYVLLLGFGGIFEVFVGLFW